MKKTLIILFLTTVFFNISFVTNAQSKTWKDYYKFKNSEDIKKPYLNIDYGGFFKNNEYFSKLKEGQTFIGFNTSIGVDYRASERIKLSAGITYLNYFGEKQLKPLIPFFSVDLKITDKLKMVFGKIESNHSHKFIEPLYSYDSYIKNYIENGIQFKFNSNRLISDTYVDWMRFIEYNAPFQEEILFGSSNELLIWKNKVNEISLPLQFMAYHRGGQIISIDTNIQTLLNGVAGIKYKIHINELKNRSLELKAYYLGFKDASPNSQLAVYKGKSLLVNSKLSLNKFDIEFSYYKSEDFFAPIGEELYFNYSQTTNHYINSAELLIGKIRYYTQIDDRLNLIVYTNLYKNKSLQNIDYCFAMDLIYNFNYKLSK